MSGPESGNGAAPVDPRTDQLTSAPDAVPADAAPRIDVTERPDGVTRIDWRDDAPVRPGGVTRSGDAGADAAHADDASDTVDEGTPVDRPTPARTARDES